MAEMKIEGLSELKARLDRLKTEDAARILNKGMRAGAAVFQAEEQSRAPERPDLPSSTALPPGALRRDVQVKKLPGKNVYIIGPGKFTSQAAHLVELGHRLVRGGKNRVKYGLQSGKGQVVGWVPPHPYIRPSFEAGKSAAGAAVTASIKVNLTKLDEKGGR